MKNSEINLKYRIIKESFRILILASIFSSIGGIAIKSVQEKIILVLPLLIILPALNDMVGDFGIIIVSKFTTYLALRQIKRPLRKSHPLKHLYSVVLPVALISAIYLATLASLFAFFRGYFININILIKILAIVLITTLFLILIIFLVSVIGGLYIHRKKLDPDDLLIPVTTSIADFGSMILYSILVIAFF